MAMSTRAIQAIKNTLLSHNALAGSKSLLAYVTFFALFFSDAFDKLFSLPSAGTSAALICVAAFPGKSIGACLQGLTWALLGVSLGAFNFYVLAKVAHSPTGQAFLFFLMVYVLGLLRASDPKWFAFSLLCILMSWNGVSTTVNPPTHQFSSGSLISYYTAYLWGGAIVLFINVFIFPHTAEKELRMTLVASLDRCRTFALLLSKTYRLVIDEEETLVRDELAQSIRADFRILQDKLEETSIEIIWSKWSMSDYHLMVHKTRALQQILTSVHTNLKSRENLNIKQFKQHFLVGMVEELEELSRSIYCSFSQLQKELAVGKQWDSLNQKEAELLKEVDLEHDTRHAGPHRVRTASQSTSLSEATARLRSVQRNLDNELVRPQPNSCSIETLASGASVSGSNPENQTAIPTQPVGKFVRLSPVKVQTAAADLSPEGRLVMSCSSFETAQYQKIGEFLASERLCCSDDSLNFHPPLEAPPNSRSPLPVDERETEVECGASCKPISSPLCGDNSLHGSCTERDLNDRSTPHLRLSSTNHFPVPQVLSWSPKEEAEIHQTLISAFSYSFSVHNFAKEMLELLEHVTGKLSDGSTRRKSLHFHFFETSKPTRKKMKEKTPACVNREMGLNTSSEGSDLDEKVELSMRQALDSLEGRQHVPIKKSMLEWLVQTESYLRGPDSICAFKTACAVSVFGILFWADETRHFATNFSLTSGLITVVVAITPTLGQSWLSFLFQILGQGVGLIYTMIMLLIFKDVGGYKYNPYGLVASLALFAAPLCYFFYSRPELFILCLLALNSAAVLAYTEFLNRNRSWDVPPYRMSKSLTTLAIALGIAASFQLLILRNPAKRTLRKATAQVMKANTAYTIILQAYVKAMTSTDSASHPSPHALQKVYHDLIKRESDIQSQIVGLMPLMKFASAEPSFLKPFNATQYLRLVRANQLILDRNRDARMAIGNARLPEFLIKQFVEKLAPHGENALPFLRASFYLCTSTLQSKVIHLIAPPPLHAQSSDIHTSLAKFPLPERLPLAREYKTALFHDALCLSIQIAKSPEGLGFDNSRDLTRYWSYILSMTSISDQLEDIGQAAKVLFGKLEDPLDY